MNFDGNKNLAYGTGFTCRCPISRV